MGVGGVLGVLWKFCEGFVEVWGVLWDFGWFLEDLWWFVVVCGGLWWIVVICGGLWWFVVVCGGLKKVKLNHVGALMGFF